MNKVAMNKYIPLSNRLANNLYQFSPYFVFNNYYSDGKELNFIEIYL